VSRHLTPKHPPYAAALRREQRRSTGRRLAILRRLFPAGRSVKYGFFDYDQNPADRGVVVGYRDSRTLIVRTHDGREAEVPAAWIVECASRGVDCGRGGEAK
jgi:hypothetical protein